jgi:Ca2+/H+ antiporter
MTTEFRSKVDGKLKAIWLAMPCMALVAIATSTRLATRVLWLPVILMVLVAVIVVWVRSLGPTPPVYPNGRVFLTLHALIAANIAASARKRRAFRGTS